MLGSDVNDNSDTPCVARWFDPWYLRNMALQQRVSDNVRILAAARGTSPAAVAEAMGRSRQWIQAKMSGRVGWSLSDVDAVSQGLGVEPTVLMTREWWPEELLRARRYSKPQPSDSWRAAA